MAGRLSLRVVAAASLAAAAALVGLDSLAFRTPWYASVLEPDSSAGQFELILRRESEAQRRYGDNLILTLGDSRFAYLPKLSDELTPETGYVFRSAGVAGTDARAWYYMLRDLDPGARRYRAIVFGVNDYDDEDGPDDVSDDLRALHYVIARLRWGDVAEFAGSFASAQARWEAFRGAVLKGLTYQADVQGFLAHPKKRLDYVRLCRTGFESWTWDYQPPERSLAGLRVNWAAWTAVFPPSMDAAERGVVERFLMYRPYPQNGWVERFRRRWFGRITERYRGSPTRIVFLRLPRGPVVRPPSLHVARPGVLREMASDGRATLLDEHAFDSLERPELFQDGLHLNREGAARFSAALAREMRSVLGPAR